MTKLGALPILSCLFLVGCGGGSSGTPSVSVTATVIATGLNQPLQYIAHPSRKDLAYVLLREGSLMALRDDVVQATPVIDVASELDTSGEGGVVGITFDPDFFTNRYFYLHYVGGPPQETRVTRYTMNTDMVSASPASEMPIFAFDQTPYGNHKGGSIHFGPDRMLYMILGDGGDGNDPLNRAQDPTTLLGKILRIDPRGDDFPGDTMNNYQVPATNPWVGTAGVRAEIWGFGVRNPFRWTIDNVTGALIFADVGQDAFEEINYEPAGTGKRNYGWRIREGAHNTGNAGPSFSSPLKDPFLEYGRGHGRSITGGFIYRGTALPGLTNRYLFGDYMSSRLWAVQINTDAGEAIPSSMALASEQTSAINGSLPSAMGGIVSIDPDANGEPVISELNTGRVIRLVPVEP